jgi:hypothetical protein
LQRLSAYATRDFRNREILSLIGGAISLTRRVPEYQKRYSVSYLPTKDKPKLDRATVREFLAFLQFVSAPLLAIVAYFLISPESKAALVALGFRAGFASEAVLLMTRSLVEISPANTIAPQTGAVSGEVVDAAANNALLANASVAIVGKPIGQTNRRTLALLLLLIWVIVTHVNPEGQNR